MEVIDKINRLIAENGITGAELCRAIGVSRAVYSQWNTKTTKPSNKTMKKIADYFGVSVLDLLANDKVQDTTGQNVTFNAPTTTDQYVSFPVMADVAAGYDHIAYQDWTGDSIDIPRSWLRGRPATDYFVIRVKGDSMYPDYQDGDHVVVLSQSTMDRSGQVGVVRYNDETATLKRIEYVMGEDWMTLRPINPQFPPVTIRDADLEECTVFGVAKYVIRELNQ